MEENNNNARYDEVQTSPGSHGQYNGDSGAATNRDFARSSFEPCDFHEGKIGLRLDQHRKETDSTGVLADRVLFARRMSTPVLLVLSFVLLAVELTYFAIWMRLFNAINSTMPKTFAWFVLLSPFGSVFHYGTCGENCRKVTNGDQEFLPIENSPPYVPTLSMLFTSLLMVMYTVFISFKSCRKPMLFYIKQLVFMIAVFVSLVLAISGSLIYRNVSKLEEIMMQELKMSAQYSSETLRWNVTQLQNQCCGLYNPADWQISGLKGFPHSCCIHNLTFGAQFCRGSGPNKLNWRGCYDLEHSKAVSYSGQLLSMTTLLLGLSVVTYFLSRKYYGSQHEGSALVPAAVSRVFMRQGSNFITFGGQNGNQHVIRKGGFMVETKGALASSSAINDQYISLEIINFSYSDTVGITREPDRILISINCADTSGLRGKAVVTSVDESNLANVVITPTASGIINIFVMDVEKESFHVASVNTELFRGTMATMWKARLPQNETATRKFRFNINNYSLLSILAGLVLGHVVFSWLDDDGDLFEVSLSHKVEEIASPSPFWESPKSTEERGPASTLHASQFHSQAYTSIGNWKELPRLNPQAKVWVVTPTYSRNQQHMSLTRTYQALYPARHFINWIVVDQTEYSNGRKFAKLRQFLRRFQMQIRLMKSKPREKNEVVIGTPKGVEGRRAALEYLRSLPSDLVGDSDVVFFADDDNVYDSDLFRQMLLTETVSLWPAGALDEYFVISPVLRNDRIHSIFGGWSGGRKYPVDFAQFAISLKLLRNKKNVTIPYFHSHLEDRFLRELEIPLRYMKPLGFNCTKIMAWHTKQFVNRRKQPHRSAIIQAIATSSLNSTNLMKLLREYNLDEVSAVSSNSVATANTSSKTTPTCRNSNENTPKRGDERKKIHGAKQMGRQKAT